MSEHLQGPDNTADPRGLIQTSIFLKWVFCYIGTTEQKFILKCKVLGIKMCK